MLIYKQIYIWYLYKIDLSHSNKTWKNFVYNVI